MARKILKFGGTSVGSLERIQAVADIIAAEYKAGNELVVVVSAMGKMTDELKAMGLSLSNEPHPREMDMLLTAGERISMSLLCIALHERQVDAQSFTGSQSGILTDGVHGNATIKTILGDRLREALANNRVAVVAGFQGMNLDSKNITTLGRGGSDLTAVALADALAAAECVIYTDVDGVYSADPRAVPEAKILGQISWQTMHRFAKAGAGILHAKAASLAEARKIPLRITSSFGGGFSGTVVAAQGDAGVVGIARKKNLCLLEVIFAEQALSELDISGLAESAGFDSYDLEVAIRGRSVFILTPCGILPKLKDHIAKQATGRDFEIKQTNEMGFLAIVGEGQLQAKEVLANSGFSLPTNAINFESSNGYLAICLPESTIPSLLETLHASII